MKIAIDISQIVYEGSGVARYVKNMVEILLRYDQKNEYVFFFSSLRGKLNRQIETAIKNKHTLKKYLLPPILLDLLWNRLHIFPIDHLIGKVDLIITSDWTEPPSRAKKITVIHDLVFLKFSETLPQKIIDVQKRRLQWVKKESALIIADSQSTKKDLTDLLNISQEKIEVVYPAVIHPRGGSSLTSQNYQTVLKKYQLTKPFILTVGKREPRKNLKRLMSAFLRSGLHDVDLVVVSSKGWKESEIDLDSSKYNAVKFLGFVPDHELYSLYQSALFFVFPSLYEGFGYPIVEAMQLGCPVATSNTSSLREIAQGNALLFDPHNEDAICQSLIKLSTDTSLREELKNKGLKRASDFSKEKFAAQLLSIFEKVYENRS
ncbi:MAG TPA: glycosyltransferase family 1 protein [Patescibacteria group bacterium]|nr:glycosyltransferase family 1 protein [Patescibacteria group bacterium]